MIDYLAEQRVSTGSSYSAIPDNEHATNAVKNALAKFEQDTAGSVLLFLSSAYSHAPQGAIKAAAKAAGTTQVFGCCAMNLLTEDEWLMDVEGAVAMVLPSDLSLTPIKILERLGTIPQLVLTLTSPNAANIAINSTSLPQIGSITSDEFGHGPFSVWQSGQIEEHEFSQVGISERLQGHILSAQGIKPLSEIMQINLATGRSLKEVGERVAIDSMSSSAREVALTKPYNLMCAISEDSDIESIHQGHFKVNHVVSVDSDTGEILISGKPKAGRHMFWAIRDPESAEQSMQDQLIKLKSKLTKPPLFALLFPNISRGAEFYGGRDRDLDCFSGAFPGLPTIGFYGNGEITPGHRGKGLIQRYTTLAVVFTEED